jgi:hypothetical protein
VVTGDPAPALYLDEDVPHGLRDRLGQMGFNVRLARDVLPAATEDSRHLKTCAENSWTIITINRKDFERLHKYWQVLRSWALLTTHHGGIISVSGDPPLADEWVAEIGQLVTSRGANLFDSMWVWHLGRREWELIRLL